jgi:addiction module RelE/StbE family toxin
MPRRYAVRYLSAAEQDLFSIHDWIASDNPERASTFVEDLDRRITKLASHPLLGASPRHPKLQEFGYRVFIIDDYLAFYKIRGRTVLIYRVVHGSRHLDNII